MCKFGILFSQEGKATEEWANIPEHSRAGYLREQYWLNRAKDHIQSRNNYIGMDFHYNIPRSLLERKHDDPPDGFTYRFSRGVNGVLSEVRWVEVVEVFAHDNAAEVNEVIHRRNNIQSSGTTDIRDFENNIDLSCPRRTLQRRTADKVIEAVRKKLSKLSYQNVGDEYGNGCLVVGLPLWFATLPLNPNRCANVLDDFVTRVSVGLQVVQRDLLDKKDCPFGRVVIVWDISWRALEDWINRCDRDAYKNLAGLQLDNPISFLSLAEILQEESVRSLIPLLSLTIYCNTTKNAGRKAGSDWKKNKAKDLKLITMFDSWAVDINREQQDKSFLNRVRTQVAVLFLKVFCFLRTYGWIGLKRLLTAMLSPLEHLRRRALNWQGRELYLKSLKRKPSNKVHEQVAQRR